MNTLGQFILDISIADPRSPVCESTKLNSSAACKGERTNYELHSSNSSMPKPDEKTIAVIRSLDNTWHRPFTTLALTPVWVRPVAIAMNLARGEA